MAAQPRYTTGQVVTATLAVVAVVAALLFVQRFGMVLVAFFVAVLLAAAVRPIVGLLERRIGSRVVADAFVHGVIVLLLLGFVVAALPLLIEQVLSLIEDLPRYYASLRESLVTSGSESIQRIGRILPISSPPPVEGGALASVSEALIWVGATAAGLLTGTAVIVLSFYWILEGDLITRSLLVLVPLDRRAAAQELIDAAGEKLAAYVRGQLIVCAAVGALAFVAYLIIGLPNALALAGMAGVLEAVPVLGPVLGAIPAGFVAMSIDPMLGVWVAVSTLFIQGCENYLLLPRVMDRSVGVNPLITILAIAAFGSVFGVIGALLAIPLAALMQLLVGRFLLHEDGDEPPPPSGRDQRSALRYEVQKLILDVRRVVRKKEARATAEADVVEDELESVAADLDRLLARDAEARG